MSRPVRALAARAIGYFAVRDLIPLYALYSLLFNDHGLSPGAISSLLVIWSVTGFIVEVPSGAWADTVSRRSLLILSSLLYAVGFTLWIVDPSYTGFAAGFVLWGTSGSLMSGTFEAMVYDELTAHGATSSYTNLMGWATSLAMVANLLGTVVAGPLFALGGYELVGWVSVGVALFQAVLALSLPAAPRVGAADEAGAARREDGDRSFAARYLAMLRDGLGEVTHERVVRRAALIASLLMGFLVFDEYFGLVAREHGAATDTVPYLIGLTVAGQAIGTAFAGRTSKMSGQAMAVALGGLNLSPPCATIGAMRTEPVTAQRWGDLEDLFGPKGASSGCWCMYFRTTSAEFTAGCRNGGALNKAGLRERVAQEPPPGLLAYDDEGTPVGWCAVAPRIEYGRVLRSRTTTPPDPEDPAVWAVTCFYIRRGRRGRGVASTLLDAAIEYARQQGAVAVEGYPLDPRGKRRQNAELYYGTVAMFLSSGFTEVERRSQTRPIMRLAL